MNILTVIIPLKNRSHYTKIYLENLYDEYFYFFADGSNNKKNEKIFSKINKKNIKYIRYSEDKTIVNYIEKINHILSFVKTPYVMFSDNDDFLIKKGIDQSLKELLNSDRESKIICAGGKITSVFQKNTIKNEYSIPFTLFDNSSLNNLYGKKDLKRIFNNYHYLYYSIYKLEYLKKFWADIKKIGLNHITLIELFLTISTIINGKYIDIKKSHYLRLRNPTSSSDKDENPYGQNHTLKIFFDNDYRNLVEKMANFFEIEYNISKKKFYKEIKFFYISNYNKSYYKKLKKNIIYRFYNYIINIFFINKLRIFNIKFVKFLVELK